MLLSKSNPLMLSLWMSFISVLSILYRCVWHLLIHRKSNGIHFDFQRNRHQRRHYPRIKNQFNPLSTCSFERKYVFHSIYLFIISSLPSFPVFFAWNLAEIFSRIHTITKERRKLEKILQMIFFSIFNELKKSGIFTLCQWK